MTEGGGVRVDAWTWSVRLYKSRSQAATAVKAGHVRVNGERAKPATLVHIGDEVRAVTDREHVVIVKQLLSKRVGAPVAATAMEDRTPALPPREARPGPVFARDPGAGRPTKRERRVLEKLWSKGR
jgi:ribosome-associated heat shock protein Hsp15